MRSLEVQSFVSARKLDSPRTTGSVRKHRDNLGLPLMDGYTRKMNL